MSKVDRELVEMLERPVDVKRLVRKLFFDIDDLEHAGLQQASLYLESGRFRAQTALRSASYKRKLSRMTGKKSIRIRRRGDNLTETAIKTQLSMDDEIQSLQKKCDEFGVYEEFGKQLTEAYKERIMVLAILARLKASEMNSELRNVKNAEESGRLRKRAEQVRKTFEELEDDDE